MQISNKDLSNLDFCIIFSWLQKNSDKLTINVNKITLSDILYIRFNINSIIIKFTKDVTSYETPNGFVNSSILELYYSNLN